MLLKWLWLTIFFSEVFSIIPRNKNLKQKITVAFSERTPFVKVSEKKLIGVDISIIENFARHYKFQISYVNLNTSLNHIFIEENEYNKLKPVLK